VKDFKQQEIVEAALCSLLYFILLNFSFQCLLFSKYYRFSLAMHNTNIKDIKRQRTIELFIISEYTKSNLERTEIVVDRK